MPVIGPSEQLGDVPYPLLDGLSPTIGWQFRPSGNGAPAFVIIRRSALGSLKVVESFPLTEDGWEQAWRSLVNHGPAVVPRVLAALQARQAAQLAVPDPGQVRELEARSLATMRDVAYLGGYVPGSELHAGERYDLRFLEERLAVTTPRRAAMLAEVPYIEVEDVEIGGPGLVKTGGGFAGGGFGAKAALEGIAIAAVLNALTTRTSIKTIVRIQATGCELFLLHTKVTPEQLRIDLSRPLGSIRAARTSNTPGYPQRGTLAMDASPVEELAKLADMLGKGLLTREEFDFMKAKLLSCSRIRRGGEASSLADRLRRGPWASGRGWRSSPSGIPCRGRSWSSSGRWCRPGA
jgi:hypothetical protein